MTDDHTIVVSWDTSRPQALRSALTVLVSILRDDVREHGEPTDLDVSEHGSYKVIRLRWAP